MRSRVVADRGPVKALAAGAASTLTGVAAFAGLALAGTAAASSASAAGGCPSPTSGVTVVVQYPSGTATGCAPGSPGTALNALRSAGFATVGSSQYHDAVVCAINNFPASTPCVMPPASAYWAIFWANRGGSWVYSNLGVASLPVKPGQYLGFRFGSGAAPSAAVPAAAATSTPAPKPTTTKATPKPSATSTPKTSTARPSTTSKAPSAQTPSTKASSPKSSASKVGSAKASNSPASKPGSTTPGAAASTGAPTVAPVTVKETKDVVVAGQKKKVITFGDGSSITVDRSSKEAKKYKVGVAKEGSSSSASAPMTTKVALPSTTSHPSISTSGSVPPLPMPAAASSGGNNLPGIVAGVGVLGAAAVGAGVTAMRRRG